MNTYTLARWIVCIAALLMLVAIGMHCADAHEIGTLQFNYLDNRIEDVEERYIKAFDAHMEEHRKARLEAAYQEGYESEAGSPATRKIVVALAILAFLAIGFVFGYAIGSTA